MFFGFLSFIAYYYLRGYIWHRILELRGHKLSIRESVYLWGFAELKRYVPGVIWSFAGRSVLFSEKGVGKHDLASALITEAELICISCFMLSCFSLPFVFNSFLHLNNIFIPLLFLVSLFMCVFFIFQKILIPRFEPKGFLAVAKKIIFSPFSAKDNFNLVLLSLLAFGCFGIGGYFTIASIIFLNPNLLLEILGFLVLSYLLGYLSFITPMGLGVREGVVTLGLSKLTTLTLAGFASIGFRIMLIISEFIFLFSAFLLLKKNKPTLRIVQFISNHRVQVAAACLIFGFILYYIFLTILRYNNFYTGRFDLGNADQIVWNTSRGRIFQMTDPDGTAIISRLAVHADFFLILLSPLYKIWSDPRLLLALQSIVAGLGGIFVFKLAKKVTKNGILSLVFLSAYLLNPALERVVSYDFHAVALATTFFLAAFYFLKINKLGLFFAFLFLAGITKEEAWLAVGLLLFYAGSPYLFGKVKNYKRGILKIFLGLLSIGIFFSLVWYVIPHVRQSQHFALSFYSDFGDSPTKVLKNIFLQPQKTIPILFSKDRLFYLLQLFSPLGFLSLFAPILLIFTLPDLGINLLSNNGDLHQIAFQYTSIITSFIFIAGIYGALRLHKKYNISYAILSLYILGASIISAYAFGPLPFAREPDLDMFVKPQVDSRVIDTYLNSIPKRYSIASTNNLGSHLSRRQRIYTIPIGMDKADFLVFLLNNDPFAQPSPKAQADFVNNLRRDRNYIQVFKQGNFIAFEKRSLYKVPTPPQGRQLVLPFSLETLEHRDYEPQKINVEHTVSDSGDFKSYVISYDSDGLKQFALLDIPNIKTPANGFPVIIVNHGYIDPSAYNTVSSYQGITNYFASHGFLVVKPDYRGNANSQLEDNSPTKRFEYPIDVMNLVVSIENITEANPNNIFLWGHSMGGEVTLKTLEALGAKENTNVKAAVLWAPVTDSAKWFAKDHIAALPEFNSENRFAEMFGILGTPEQNPNVWKTLSPLSYLKDIKIPILLQHGTSDPTVPYAWSLELENLLKQNNKQVTFISYPNNDHNLSQNFNQAAQADIDFFQSLVK